MLPLIQGSRGVPDFTIDYEKYSSPSNPDVSLLERVRSAVVFPLSCVAAFALSLGRATRLTVWNAPISFLRIIVGYRGVDPWDVPSGLKEVSSRIVRWVLGLGLNILKKTSEGVESRIHLQFGRLSQEEIGPDLNLRHLRMQHREISITHVPEQVKIEKLMDLCKEINFTDPSLPGYMFPLTRREGSKDYTIEELEQGLARFIHHVRNRVPFIGTPPEFDIDGLEKFYRQIEDAVRFSMHTSDSKLKQCSQSSPEYQNLLEDRARIALDLAIAGHHCGARYMGDAMELYNYFNAGAQCVSVSLEDQLVEILSRTRLAIAREEAGAKLGSDVHGFSKYLQVMGPLLGLPGTANVIEHLMSTPTFDIQESVHSFFKRYTVPVSIEAVCNHYRTSSSFRDQVAQWLVSSMGDWKREEYEGNIPAQVEQINVICKAHIEALPKDVETFDRVIEWVGAHKKDPQRSIDHYLCEAGRDLSDRSVSSIFSQNRLGTELFEEFATALATEDLSEDFRARCIQRLALVEKIREVQKVIPELLSETIERIIRGVTPTQEAVCDTAHRERAQEFLGAILPLDAENTLSPELIEWMLVHHQIFLPQKQDSVPETLLFERCHTATIESIKRQWGELDFQQEPTPSATEGRYTRYIVLQSRPTQELLVDALFNRTFKACPDALIAATEGRAERRFYPLWKRVCFIQFPEKVSGFLQSKITQRVLFCIVSWKAYSWSRHYAQEVIPQLLMHRVVPFVKERIPSAIYQEIVQRLEKLSALHLRVASQPFKYFMASWAVSAYAPRLPTPLPLLTRIAITVGRMHLLMSPDSPYQGRWYLKGSESGFLVFLGEATPWGQAVQEKVGVVGRLISQFAAKERAHSRALSKQEALRIWREGAAFREPAAL
jgi:hypothetical protein